LEREIRDNAAAGALKSTRSGQRQSDTCGAENGVRRLDCDLVADASVIESGPAFHPERHLAPHAVDLAHDVVPKAARGARLDGHEIGDFADSVFGQEARKQDIGLGKVHLPMARFAFGADAEEPSLLIVEYRGKDTRRIEVRKAAPIDGSVPADERR
jgi:hypothetical protein